MTNLLGFLQLNLSGGCFAVQNAIDFWIKNRQIANFDKNIDFWKIAILGGIFKSIKNKKK